MNLKFTASAALLAIALSAASAQEAPKAPEYEFTVIKENPITSIKNQYRPSSLPPVPLGPSLDLLANSSRRIALWTGEESRGGFQACL